MSDLIAANQEEVIHVLDAEAVERVLVSGDLSKLDARQRITYYKQVCDAIGLLPITEPFAYIQLNGKLKLYALKSCTEQLRKMYNISLVIVSRETTGDVHSVIARATFPNGRVDESVGAVAIGNLKGDNLANALMKCETKAKRRVTLSICGLGMLDHTEIETIASAKIVDVDLSEGKADEANTLLKALTDKINLSKNFEELEALAPEIREAPELKEHLAPIYLAKRKSFKVP